MATLFSERARRAILVAQSAAKELGHDRVAPAHLLLGLLNVGEGAGFRVLRGRLVDARAARQRIEEELRGLVTERGVLWDLPFTPESKKVLEEAIRAASAQRHGEVGTGHLLLGLRRGGADVVAAILDEAGVTESDILEELRPCGRS